MNKCNAQDESYFKPLEKMPLLEFDSMTKEEKEKLLKEQNAFEVLPGKKILIKEIK